MHFYALKVFIFVYVKDRFITIINMFNLKNCEMENSNGNCMMELSINDMARVNGGDFLRIISFDGKHLYFLGLKFF